MQLAANWCSSAGSMTLGNGPSERPSPGRVFGKTDPDPLAHKLLELVRTMDPITEHALHLARGATLSQLAVLRRLGSETFTVSALAEGLGIHRSSASRMVDRMVTAGLVRKVASPTSRREVLVTATPKGRHAASDVAQHRLAALGQLLARLDASERSALSVALDALLLAASTPKT